MHAQTPAELGQGRSSQEVPTVPPTATVGTQSPTTTLADNETQPVCFAPQYKTSYMQVPDLQTGWAGGLEYDGIFMANIPALGFKPNSLVC